MIKNKQSKTLISERKGKNFPLVETNRKPIAERAVFGWTIETHEHIIGFDNQRSADYLLLEIEKMDGLFERQQFQFKKEKLTIYPL